MFAWGAVWTTIPSSGSHCPRQQGYAKYAILTVQVIAKVHTTVFGVAKVSNILAD
jgi:hypothetical protein